MAEYENAVFAAKPLNFIGDAKEKRTPLKSNFSPGMEMKVGDLKRSLDGWREIVLPINSIISWEKQWHPLSIVGCCTTFFMMLWLLDPSILTTISLIGLTLTLSDYIVPHLATSLLKSEPWTEKQEEKFDRICRSMIISQEKISLTFRSFCLMRTTNPKLYYGISVSILLSLAWIGNNVNNLLLTYFITTFLCLLPGMGHHGILQKYSSMIMDRIVDMATKAELNVADLKKDK